MSIGQGMKCLFDHEISMRDGVILRGDLYLPDDGEKHPVLLLRSIFRKDRISRAFAQYDPTWYVKRGYAVYIQDVRGLGHSDGTFDRFTADGKDGYDTIESLAAENWCTGKVGMFGSYFAGYLQLMAALEAPPHLTAICPMQTSVSINRDCDNRGFMFFSHIGWCMSRLCNRLEDGRYDEETTQKWLPLFRGWLKNYPKSQLSVWPARNMPVLQDTPFPMIRDYFHHLVEGYDDFDLLHKEGRDIDTGVIRVPAFYIAGWYDSSRTPLIDHCLAQVRQGCPSKVLVGPWNNADLPARPDSALESGVTAVDLQREITSWFDHWLLGKAEPDWENVRYYSLSGSLYEGATWPPEQQKSKCLYLAECRLLDVIPEDGFVFYEHDPLHPLPYHGYGPAESLSDEDSRSIYFDSDPFTKDLEVCGLPEVSLTLSSTAKDADVMISLCDVSPDGSAFSFCDGAVRARYRNSWTPEPLTEGQKVQIRVLCGHVHYMIPRGNHLSVRLSGSAFPKYDVNHGTAARPADDANWVCSTQTVLFGKSNPSRVTLPLI